MILVQAYFGSLVSQSRRRRAAAPRLAASPPRLAASPPRFAASPRRLDSPPAPPSVEGPVEDCRGQHTSVAACALAFPPPLSLGRAGQQARGQRAPRIPLWQRRA